MDFRKFITSVMLTGVAIIAYSAVPPTKLTNTITWEITDEGVLKVYGTGAIPDFKKEAKNAWHQKTEKLKGINNSQFAVNKIEIGEGITSIGTYAFSGLNYGSALFHLKSSGVRIEFPSTLKEIDAWAFYNLKYVSPVLPEGLEKIGSLAFQPGYQTPPFNLVIPESVTYIVNDAFYSAPIIELTILGNTKIGDMAFAGTFSTHTLKKIIIEGHPTVTNNADPFYKQKDYTAYIADRGVDAKSLGLTEGTVIYSTPAEDNNVKNYVASRMPAWDDFLEQKIAAGKLLSKQDMENKLEAWQAKGEFEPTEDWKRRVNDETRRRYLNGMVAERQKEVEGIKKEYENLRKYYINEFYAGIIDRETAKIKNDKFKLMPYDADNQTYLITTEHNGDILLKVPVNKAKQFKADWEQRFHPSLNLTPQFVPNSENSVALQKIKFYVGSDEYVYDGSDAKYAVTDVNYNFAPLEIEEIDASSFSMPTVAEAPVSKTVGGSAITKRKVEVAHNTATAGSGVPANRTSAVRSDVDKDVPKGNQQRPNTFALVIANENYRRVAAVPYAINDGRMVSEYLKTTLGIPEKNIIYVEDGSLNDINYNLKRLAEIARAYKGDASVIVYYAGHGVPDDKTKDAYLLPVDGYAESPSTSGLSLASFITALTEMPTRSSALFLDACFSGGERSGDNSAMLIGARGVRIKPNKDGVAGNLVMFSATHGEETAQPYDEQQHGLFTYYLLKKLREAKGDVTIGELSDYVIDNVERTSAVNGKPQTPTVTVAPENSSWRSSAL